MGDNGAFSYVKEYEPPFSVDEVLHFYTECHVDYGISVDHVILQYNPVWDQQGSLWKSDRLEEARRRQLLTLGLAEQFIKMHRKERLPFVPLGVAQGWSPGSYSQAIRDLQKMGYKYIALGGLVPLKTPQILDVLRRIEEVREKQTALHLLGITRCENSHLFERHGVASFDSTSPLRQAFMDETDNYYTIDGTHPAIRVPQVDGNLRLKRRVAAGEVSQSEAIGLERRCMQALLQYDRDGKNLETVVALLSDYETLYNPNSDRSGQYRRVLMEAPWKDCDCDICRQLGIHVIIFRGAERNRRRGFHNLWVFRKRLLASDRNAKGKCGQHMAVGVSTSSVRG